MTHVTTSDTTQGDLRSIKQRLEELERRASSPQPPIVTALPENPVDTQEIIYLADATNGIEWRFRYRAASASAYKWEFIGGPPIVTGIQGGLTTAKVAETKQLLGGPSITVPLDGEYDIAGTIRGQQNEAGVQEMQAFISLNGALTGPLIFDFVGTGIFALMWATNMERVAQTKGGVLTIGCLTTEPVKCSFNLGRLTMVPVRVG